MKCEFCASKYPTGKPQPSLQYRYCYCASKFDISTRSEFIPKLLDLYLKTKGLKNDSFQYTKYFLNMQCARIRIVFYDLVMATMYIHVFLKFVTS